MAKLHSTKLKQYAETRGFTVRQERGRFILVGPAEYGPADFADAKAFLSEFPTARQREARARRDAHELTKNEIDHRRRRRGYDAPIFEPELGEPAPDGLLGLHEITVLLPAGADPDDCLRSLFVMEDRERRRGAVAVRSKIEEARALIAGGGLEPHRVVASDHDEESARAYNEGLPVVLLASWLLGLRFVRVGKGPHGLRTKVDVLAEWAR